MTDLAITHIFDQPQSGYSCSFDLRLDPMRLDHVGALKRLSTKGGDLEDSQQAIDLTGKDVGNCKTTRSGPHRKRAVSRWWISTSASMSLGSWAMKGCRTSAG